MSLSVTGKPHLLDVLRRSSAARTCFRNYQADWHQARQATTNRLPKHSDLDNQGNLLPGHAYGAIFYLHEHEVISQLSAAQTELASAFPPDSVLWNSADLFHLAGLIFRNRSPQPLTTADLEAGQAWGDFIARLCSDQPPPQFSIYGTNLTENGVLYAKCYPHSDNFQTIRDLAQERYPQMRYKDAFNLTLGRLYKQLSPEDYARARSVIQDDFLHSYLGTITFDTINIMNLPGGALIAQGEVVRTISFA